MAALKRSRRSFGFCSGRKGFAAARGTVTRWPVPSSWPLGVAVLACRAVRCGPTPLPARPRTVLHYGDSLTVGTGPLSPRVPSGWSISQSADVSRHAYEGPQAVEALRLDAAPRARDQPRCERRSRRGVRLRGGRATGRAVRPGRDRCVIWSTVVRPPYNGVSYDGYNRVLRRAALDVRELPRLRLAGPRQGASRLVRQRRRASDRGRAIARGRPRSRGSSSPAELQLTAAAAGRSLVVVGSVRVDVSLRGRSGRRGRRSSRSVRSTWRVSYASRMSPSLRSL